ncbi:tandem-95 repeat protein [Rhodopseudomonas palustris]|uniref:T1SS-143 repeat domain-containing protein n=1 Tax=Rhodopseudomonas palustris TaxID=1076 RepID=UPI002ACD9C59|nr:Ig-like domain-containing protein [Rhodopseudomonas palustris]WQH01342.1 tandem-95 repeat protein [Rhodopseudomonas palustris]
MKLAKPQSGQAVTVHLDGAARIDFSEISSEKLTFVRIGDRLIILFDNQSTVSIDPVFSNTGAPLPEVSFEMALDRVLDGTAFAELFPITTDQSVLPAAGTPGAPSSPSGANFGSFTIDALSGGTPLDLLGAEASGTQVGTAQQTATSTPIPGGADTVILNEDGLFEGQPGGLGDTGGTLTSFTGSLNIDFGTDVIGRSLSFAATQPGLTGLTSGGQAVNLQFTTINGQPALIGYTGSDPSVAANQVFIISLDVNSTIQGAYTVTLLRPLDHPVGGTEDTLSLTIDVVATDGSGDTAPLSIVISVNDDSPVAGTVVPTALVEQTGEGNLFVSSAVTASLGIGWGADGGNSSVDGGSTGSPVLGDRSLVFANSTLVTLTSLGLTSNGETISYALSADGTSIVATAGDGRTVFTVALSDVDSGSYTFTLLDNLDHVGVNGTSQPLTFAIVATDADGDPVASNFTVDVTDDVPVANPGDIATVEDESLSGGNNEDDGLSASVSGVSLNIDWNSDDANTDSGQPGDRSVAFSNADVAVSGAFGETLTSLGQQVSFTILSTGELVGYTGESAPTSISGSNVVFYVALSDVDNGEYSFTLVKPLDHASGNGENTLALNFNYTATDSDGDTSSSVFQVQIVDDMPIANPGTTATVEDESLTGGNNEAADGLAASVSNVSLNIAWGADNGNDNNGQPGDRAVAFSNAAVAVSGAYGEALTSLGQTVQFTLLADGTLVGYTGATVPSSTAASNVVLFATLSDLNNGEYNFTLKQPLDHAAGSDENALSLTFNYTATDSDGDTSSSTFTVSIVDDVPLIGTPYQDGVVEEEQPIVVGAGNEDFGGAGDADTGITVVGVPIVLSDRTTQSTGGTLAIAWGADDANDGNGQPGDRAVAFTAEGVAALEAQQLTSRGAEIHYKVFTVNGGQVLVAYTGSVEPASVPANTNAAIAAHVVFTVSLSDSGSGSYQFTLVDTIDHPGEVQGEESLALQFQFTATDSDGDTTAPASFSVKVIDDAPVAIGTILTRTVEEEQLAGGNEDTRGAGDGDFTLFGFADVTTASAGGPLNIFWGGDDSNTAGNGGYTGTQVAGDRSVVFGGSNGAYVADGVISAAVAAQFIGVSGGNGAINLDTLTSGGQALVYTLSANGTVLTATAGNQTVFTVTLSDQGSGGYVFNLSGVLDHPVAGTSASQEDTLSFTFTFTARDGDGDIARDTFTVNVIDDSPVANTGTASRVEDESLAGGNNEAETPNLGASVSNVSLNIAWGADNANDGNGQPGDRSVAFGSASVTVSGAYQGTTLTSLGVAVHTAVLSDGTLVGYTGATVPNSTSASNVVFFATLSDANSGEYSFTLVKPLDHAAGSDENALALTFAYTATDSDGDTSSSTFTVSIVDDAPVIGTPYQDGVVEEEQWIVVGPGNEDTSGAADGDYWGSFFGIPYFVDATTETTGGTLAIAWGADSANDNNGQPGDRSVSFTAAGIAALEAQHLTSRGEQIHYKVFTLNGGEVLVAYTGDIAPSAVPSSTNAAITAHVVFIVGLSDAGNGSYAFKLVDTIDHPGAVQGEDVLSLAFGFAATDSDGDTATSSFTVRVIDDAPVIGRPDDETVREVNLPTTNYDTTHPDYPNSTVQTGDLDISWGADDNNSGAISNRSVAFTTSAGASGLTSDGSAISYTLSPDGTTLTAVTADSRVVFTVQLSDSGDGSYTFTLFDSIDHPSSGPNDDSLPLTFGFKATDGDGDTATSSFTVTIRDDEPTVGPNTTVRLDDDTLGGNPGGNGDDADAVAKTGTLVHNGGADGTASVLWSSVGLTLPSSFWFEVSADGTVMTITQDQGNGYVPVLTMTITNTATGAYSVAQVAPIDHPQGTIPGFEDNVQFTVSYIVTDGDGDTATGTISVNVDDDTPTVAANALIQLDDDALLGGNAGGVGDDVESPVLTGVLSHSGGADGTASVLWAPNGLSLPFGFWFTLSPDSKTMTITQLQDGTYVGVFQATITDTATGAYQITQLAAVKHNTPGIEDNAEISFQYRVTDGDGDVATGTLSFNVDDDTATIGAIATRTVTELTASGFSNAFQAQSLSNVSLNISWGADDANPTAGAGAHDRSVAFAASLANAVPAGITSNGFDLIYLLSADGQTLTAYRYENGHYLTGSGGDLGASPSNSARVFSVSLSDGGSGSYNFTLHDNLDQASGLAANTLPLSFGFTATDSDGDVASGSFTVEVIDDLPITTGAPDLGAVTEVALAGGLSLTTGALNIDWNADDFGGRHLEFVTSGGNPVITPGLTSDGVPLVYVVRAASNGFDQELIAYKTGDAQIDSNAVFIIALNSPSNPTYVFTLYQNLDHTGINGTTLPVTFEVRGVDGDGDAVDQAVTVNVADDTPTLTQVYRYNDVHEAQLSGGPDVDGHSFAVQFGADGYGATAFTGAIKLDIGPGLAGNVSFDVSAGAHREPLLTSEGRAITFVKVDANTIRGYVAAADNGGNPDETIIEIKLTDTDASATTTLYGVIDHIAVQDGSQIDGIRVDATVAFSDGDGDVVTGIIRTTIHDDVPVSTGAVTASTVLDDDALAGNAGGAGDVPDATTASGGPGALFAIGADGLKSVVLGTTTAFSAIYTDANGVSHSEAVTWGAPTVIGGATTWIAAGAHGDAARLTIGADGSYTFTVLKPLVHPTSGATEETLTLTFNYTVTDGDNDAAAGSLTVNVNDDTPTLAQVYRYNDVHEAQLSGGPDVDGHSFAVQFGADGYGATAFTGAIKLDIGPGLAGNVSFDVSAGAHREPLLTSEGRAITFVKVDANTIRGYVASADNGGNPDETIIEIKLTDTDVSATTTLYGVIDHIAVQDGSQIDGIRVDATVAFSDGDGDVVTGIIRTTIHDDAPVSTGAVTASTVLDDDAFAGNAGGAGDVLDATTVSGAAGALFTIGADGLKSVVLGATTAFSAIYTDANGVSHSEAVTWGAPTVIGGATTWIAAGAHGDAARLTIGADGSYTFTALKPLVHPTSGATEETLTLTFNYTVTDGDNDAAAGSLTVNVNDDTPTLAQTYRYNDVDESHLGGGAAVDGHSFAVQFGADGYGATAFTGAIKLDIGPGLAGNVSFDVSTGAHREPMLTSEGRAITFVKVDANTIRGYVASADNGGNPDETIIEIKLTDTDASATTTLYGVIDHIAVQDGSQIDGIRVDATVAFSDGDGDVVTGIIRTTISDDVPTVAVIANQSVTETTASGFSNVFQVQSLSNVSLNISWGADDANPTAGAGAHDRSVAFAASLANAVPAGITSNGFDLIYLRSADGQTLTAYRYENGHYLNGSGNDLGTSPSNSARVFSVSLSDSGSGSYSFTLYDNLDHASGADALPLNFGFTATDSDGDATSGSFTVDVVDDVPLVTANAEEGSVEERYLDGPHPTTFGNLAIDWNADDRNVHLTFTSTTITDDLGNVLALTSGGIALKYAIVPADGSTNPLDQKLIAYKDGDTPDNPVFSVNLISAGNPSYQFVLYQALDHSGSYDDTLPLTFSVTGYDGDGDAVTQSLTVTVEDWAPLVTANAEEGSVEERYLDGPRPSTFGNLAIDWNADDRNVHLTFTNTTVTDDLGNVLALTSGGVALKYAIVSADGSTNPLDQKLIAYKDGDTPANPVFTVNLISAGNPSYQFVLYQALDHSGSYDDTLPLTFSVTGYDGDGDAVTQSLTVTLEDWSPQSSDVDAKTIEEAAGSVSTGNVDLEIDFGADGGSAGASVTFVSAGPLTVKTQDGNAVSLTSLGVGLSYVLSADGATLTAYRFNGTDYISETGVSLGSDVVNASAAAVFTVTLSDAGTGSYNFTLLQPLDHPAATGSVQQLTLDFGFQIKDGDGDTDTNNFSVIVDAAGAVSIGYTAPDSALFVNMSETSQTVDGQTVAAHSVTDRASVTDRVVGLDRLGSITMADGGSAGDILIGGAGNNKLFGNGGDDTLIGGGGLNTIQGGTGNDTIIYTAGSGGIDTVDGGADTDTQIVNGTAAAETFNINAINLGGGSYLAANIDASGTAADGTNFEVATTAVEEWLVSGGGGGDTFNVSGALLGTGIATSTLTINGDAGNDTLDLTGYAHDVRIVSDGGADADTVKFAFKTTDATYAKVFAQDGVTLIGVEVTYNGVTSTFTNYESFVFTDGTRSLPALFNTAPLALDDTVMASEDAPLSIDALLGLLNNDSDIDGNTLTVTGVANATHGTVALNNGNPIFTPTANFSGVAGFDYTVSDGNGGTATAHVTVDVAPKADAPVLSSSSTNPTKAEEVAIDLSVGAALADLDGSETMTVSLGGVPSGFVLTDGQGHSALSTGAAIVLTGWTLSTLSLTPPSNYNGAFTVEVSATVTDSAVLSDGQTHTDVRTEVQSINVVVTPVNDVPVAGADALSSVKEDSGVRIISFTSLLGNDSAGPANESGQTLTITALSNVIGGTAVINGTNILFTPAANFNGTASFDYTVQDNGQTAGIDDFKSSVGQVSFSVTPVADAPVGTSNTVTATEDGAHIFTAAEFGFTDPLDSPANNFTGVVISTLPMAGTLTNHGVAVTAGSLVSIADINAGYLVFTPAANGNGDDYASFTFRVQDDGAVSGGNSTFINNQFASGWSVPAGASATWGTMTGGPSQITDQTAVAFAQNIGGPNAKIQTDTANQPNAIAHAGESYHLTFDALKIVGYGTAPVTVQVYAGNTLIGQTSYTLTGGAPSHSIIQLTTSVVGGGNDNQPLKVVWTAGGGHGDAIVIDDVALTKVGGAGSNLLVNGDFGPGSYYVGDNVDGTPRTMTIDVTPVNDLPVAVIDNPSGDAPGYTITEDTIWATFNAIGNDTLDPDAGAPNSITIGAITVPTNYYGITASDLSVTVAPDNKIRVELLGTNWQKLANGTFMTIPISYTLHGDGTDASTAQMMIRVTGVNDAPVLDVSKSPAITLAEDAGGPSFAGKVQVSSLAGFAGTAGIGNVTDDGYIVGIAITGANAANGTWSWSIDGTTWFPINAASLSDSNALLLYGNYYVYFQPAAGFDGTVSNGLTIRAWDQSAGTPGSYANTTTNGGSTAFSSATDTVVVTVTPSNDAPDFGNGVVAGSVTQQIGVPPASVLTNGGFESGSAGWTASSTEGGSNFGSGFPGEGSYNFTANSFGVYTAVKAQLAQTVSTLPGVQYTLSFSVATTSLTPDAHVYVNWNGQQVAAIASGQASGGGYQTFTVAVTGTGSDTLQFVIDDANNPATFDAWYLDAVALTPTAHYESTSGTISFSDDDVADVHSVSVTTPQGSSYVGHFVPVVDQAGNTVNWTFYASDAEMQGLPANSVDQVYTLTISDGNGGFDTQDVTVTLVKHVNSAPVITSSAQTGVETEDASFGVANLVQNPTFELPDVFNPVLTPWSVSGGGATIYGSGANGSVNSLYLSPDSAISQTLTTVVGTTYTINYFLQNGGTPFSVSVNGTPVWTTNAVLSNWTEYSVTFVASSTSTVLSFGTTGVNGASLDEISVQAGTSHVVAGIESSKGTITYSDANLVDTHTVTAGGPTFSWSGGSLSQAQIDALTTASSLALTATDSVGTGTGSVAWKHSIADSAIQFLGAGQTLTGTYTVSIDDGRGGFTSQQVAITINGVNDDASIGGTGTGTVKEDGTLTAGGTLTIADADSGQSLFQTPMSLTGTYGTFTFNATTGAWGYTLNNSASNVQDLNATDVVHDTLIVTSADGTASRTIDVTIQGADEVVASPLTVNDTTSASGRYAFSPNSSALNAVNLDASTLFSGGTGPVSYSYQLVYASGDSNWISLSGNQFTGNPHDSQRGVYVYKATATDSVTSVSTYFALSVLDDGALVVQILNDSEGSATNSPGWVAGYSAEWSDLIVGNVANPNNEANAAGGYDVMLGQAGVNRFDGGSEDDTLYGFAGSDILNGGSGNDFIDGGAGNDTITGGTGNDVLVGGSGADLFNYTIGDGNDIIDGGAGTDTLAIAGSNGNDTLGVVIANNAITQFPGNSVVNVERVILDLGLGTDTLSYAGTTQDVIVNLTTGTATGFASIGGVENVTGGSGNDILAGNAGANVFNGGAGRDTIVINAAVGWSGDSVRSNIAGNGNDVGTDTIVGFDLAQDTLKIVATNVRSFVHGTDTAIGTAGNSSDGSAASFTVLTGLVELNQFNDGKWTDTGDIAITFNSSNGAFTEASFESRLQYDLTGTNNGDTLTGGSLNDVLNGSGGSDHLSGGGGSDTLTGGSGNDTLRGGTGSDVFKFSETGSGNLDAILDYSSAEGDTLDLSALLDAAYGSGNNVDANFVRLVNEGNDVKVQVDVNGATGGQNWADVALLQGYHTAGNTVLAQFENTTHTLTVAA